MRAPKVLVIDDSEMLHGVLRAALQAEGVEPLFASTGVAGLALAAETRPDTILLDVDLPDISGFEVCRVLKSSPATSATPIIFVTVLDETHDKVRGLDLGAVDYVTKPFDVAELQARVRVSLRLRYMHELLARRAMIDGLTGLWNRAYLEQWLRDREGGGVVSELGVLMLDIDHFKLVNDRHGHPFGDEVLRRVGRVVMGTAGSGDVVCRYGGEEFVVLAPEADAGAALDLAERIREAVRETTLRYRLQEARVTCSLGVSAGAAGRFPQLIAAADQALYQAKTAGRDRCMLEPAAGADGQAKAA